MLVYISGAIRNDPDGYMQKFDAAEIDVKDAGHKAINPAKFINGVHGLSDNQIMDICYQLLDMADAIYLLPDWTLSLGANQEVGFARAKGMMFLSPETLTRNYETE